MADPSAIPDKARLREKIARHFFWRLLFLSAAIFLPAGTIWYWQGWAFLAAFVGIPSGLEIYFYHRDPEALARRLLSREKNNLQKVLMLFARGLFILVLILAGWDFQYGWTPQFVRPVPVWFSILALTVIVAADFWFVIVLQANRFAASVIRVESGQIIAATGPYRFIRHPMYLGMLLKWLAIAPALGSFIVWPLCWLILPVFVLRLLQEEKLLQRELPGYAEYCRRTPRCLVPFIW
jgi:protein-S-isoprenylcysteine O-methyltransferase Ste14